MFKHGHENSQGGPISTTVILSSTYMAENFESSSICKKIVTCMLCRHTLFNHVIYNECSSIGTHFNLYCL